MNKMTQVLLSLMAIFLIVGCGGNKPSPAPRSAETGRVMTGPDLEPMASKDVIKGEPKWYRNCDAPEGFICIKGEGTSKSKSLAWKKAKTAMTVDLNQKLEVLVKARTVNFQKEIGSEYSSELIQEFETTEENIMNKMLGDWIETNSKTNVERNPTKANENIYRCYLTGQWNKHNADQMLLEELKNRDRLRTAYEATKGYKDMLDAIERDKDKFGN